MSNAINKAHEAFNALAARGDVTDRADVREGFLFGFAAGIAWASSQLDSQHVREPLASYITKLTKELTDER